MTVRTIPTPPAYKWTQLPDGELIVHDVPIFVECSRGDYEFGADWIAKAVARARDAAAEGYHPPLHVKHHKVKGAEDGETVRSAGYFCIKGAQTITFKKTQRLAIIADLHVTNPEVQEEIKAKRLPYRSVEIFNVEVPAIDSLALLDHEAPFLELPMLALAGGAPSLNWSMESAEEASPVKMWFSRGEGMFALLDEVVATVTEQTKTREEPERKQKALFQDEPDGDKKKSEDKSEDMEDGGGLDVGAVVKAIASGEISVADMDAILAAIHEQRSNSATEEPAEEAAPAAVPGGEAMAKEPTDTAAQMAALQGKVDAQQARLDAKEAADKRREDVAAAMKRIEGRPFGADPEAKFVAFHEAHGPEAFAAYVDSIVETLAVDTRHDDPRHFTKGDKAPKFIMERYAEDGTEAIDRALDFAREWEQLKGSGMKVSQERYVELSMERWNTLQGSMTRG